MHPDYFHEGTNDLLTHIKSGLVRNLFAKGLLTPAQRDELLRRLRQRNG